MSIGIDGHLHYGYWEVIPKRRFGRLLPFMSRVILKRPSSLKGPDVTHYRRRLRETDSGEAQDRAVLGWEFVGPTTGSDSGATVSHAITKSATTFSSLGTSRPTGARRAEWSARCRKSGVHKWNRIRSTVRKGRWGRPRGQD